MARYALVIGVAAYNNFRNLEKAVTDAEAIAQLLERQGNFQEVKRLPPKWLKDEGRWTVTGDKKLTGKELGNALRTFLLEQATKNEAVIYFAGHGFPVSSCMGVEEGYLATSDCAEDGRNAIPLRHFNALMVESDLSSLVVMLDCCYAGTLLERQLLEPTFTAFNTKRDYYLISACRGFQKAYEGVEHGVFTGAILKGLAAENADEKGQVSGDRLFDFIASELKGSSQEPIRMGWGRALTLVQYQPKKTEIVVDETCPYQGLEAFGKEQARFFFGREKVVQLLMEKLGQANFVPIIGASGSGKSSVVRAGLIPQLEKNGWRVLEPILPGDEPLAELKTVLIELFGRTEGREVYSLIRTDGLRPVIERLSGSERLLLVVDQFEEVFTLCPKEEERCQFIELLTQVVEIPASRLAIVTTMRADFLEPCLSYESLTRLIQDEAVYMPPLVGADLEEAIASPAELQGYRIERGLLGAIHQDVGQEKGCLPLLQFALTELWDQRDRSTHQLTLAKYNQLGGVIGALNCYAEQIYQSLTKHEQDWVKRIFLKLVGTGEGVKDTRLRQPKAELLVIAGDNLAVQQAISNVLDELIRGHLLITGQENQQGEAWVDLAHEALMYGWQQFAQWRQEKAIKANLIEQADRVLDLLDAQSSEGLVLAIQLIDVSLKQLGNVFRPIEDSLYRVMKKTVWGDKLFRGHEDCICSVAFSPDGQTIVSGSCDRTLRLWDFYGSLIEEPFRGHEGDVCSVAFSPDGQLIVSGSQDGTVRLWNLHGNLIGQPFQGHESYVWSVAFSPDGQTIASGGDDWTVRLWNLHGNLIGQPFKGHESSVFSVAFSPDGQTLVTGSDDQTVRLWNLHGNLISQPFQGHEMAVRSVAFSPDAQTIVSGSWDRTVRLWNLQGKPIGQPFQRHERYVLSVAFSPDGQTIASGSWDGTVCLWNLHGNLINQLFQGKTYVRSIAFSPDGQTLASGSDDRILHLWHLQDKLIDQPFQVHEFQAHESNVWSVAFNPAGQTIVSGGWDGTLRLWDLQGKPIGQPFQGHEMAVRSVAFSPDGRTIASGSNDRTVRLWDLHGNPIGQPFQGHESYVLSVAFSPDDQTVLTGSWDGTLRLWDLHGNLIGQPLQAHGIAVRSVAFSPDGQTIASGSDDRTVCLWDLQGKRLGQPFQGHEDCVWSVAFSPDGQTIVSGSRDRTLRLWDTQGNPISQPFQGHEGCITSVTFSPDGDFIVSGSDDQTVRLWQVGWRAWLRVCCDRLRYHPVFQNPQTEEAKAACEICRKYVWDK